MSSRFEFASKVVAAGTALFPLVFLYDDVKERKPEYAHILENPYAVGIFAFGTSLAATGDTKATLTAISIVSVLYVLQSSMEGEVDESEAVEDEKTEAE